MRSRDVLVSLDEGTHHDVLHDGFTTERGYSSSRRVKNKKEGAEAQQEIRYLKRAGRPQLAVKVELHSACAAPSSRPRSHVPTHCSFSRAGSPAVPWEPGRPLPSWSPLVGGQSAALLDWSCFGAQYVGKAATWCPQVVFCPQAQAWTRPVSSVWRD